MFRRTLWLVSLVTLVALISWADAWDKKTKLQVNEAIRVPGAILQPGTYVIKLVDSPSDRHIVRIMNEAEDEVITTILAIPNYRLTPTGDSQFEFWETPAGNPRAIRAWFHPGDNFGQEFTYPEGLSARVAKTAEPAVPTTIAQKESELSTAPVISTEKPIPTKPLQAQVYKPTPPAPTPAAAPEPTPPAPEQARQKELPATGSSIPVFALAALFAFTAGLVFKKLAS